MIDFTKITDIFCLVDEFCNDFDKTTKPYLLGKPSKRPAVMSKSEVISICLLFHLSGFRCFKHFYMFYVQRHMQAEFPRTVSYNRFVELCQSVVMPMTIFLKTCCLGTCTGISFVDSTPIRVCHNKRIKRNKVFKGIAEVGKSTMGWFYGFKLHVIINDQGEIMAVKLTSANVNDLQPIPQMTQSLTGKLFGDKGYISQPLFNALFQKGLHLITRVRKNMKNKLILLTDKLLLRRRGIIESVNDQLNNISQIEHSRHRSPWSFAVNLLAALIAYCLKPKKPSLNLAANEKNLMIAIAA